MGLSLVTGPTFEPVTLTEAKDHLRVTDPTDDGLIAGYILAARKWIEGQTHRALVTQTWDYTIDCDWPFTGYVQRIELPLPPLQSVESITYVDSDGSSQTLASDQYTALTDRPRGLIVPAYNVTWPTVRNQHSAITVRFVAGKAQPDDEFRQAILMLLGHFYENRESVVVGQMPAEVPFSVEALISPFRVP